MRRTFEEIGREAAAPPFALVVLRGIFSGWLIALMVWLLPGADQMRLFVILIVTWVVGIGALSHVIAGSVEVLYVVAEKTPECAAVKSEDAGADEIGLEHDRPEANGAPRQFRLVGVVEQR